LVSTIEDLVGLPGWPRRLSREQAAKFVGVSPALFDTKVADKTLPGPIAGWGRRKLWDTKALELALDKEIGLSGQSAPSLVDPISEAVDAY
jgi:hypothetical protein